MCPCWGWGRRDKGLQAHCSVFTKNACECRLQTLLNKISHFIGNISNVQKFCTKVRTRQKNKNGHVHQDSKYLMPYFRLLIFPRTVKSTMCIYLHYWGHTLDLYQHRLLPSIKPILQTLNEPTDMFSHCCQLSQKGENKKGKIRKIHQGSWEYVYVFHP